MKGNYAAVLAAMTIKALNEEVKKTSGRKRKIEKNVRRKIDWKIYRFLTVRSLDRLGQW